MSTYEVPAPFAVFYRDQDVYSLHEPNSLEGTIFIFRYQI